MSSESPETYWNDESQERGKPFWVASVDDPKWLSYAREESNLERCFRDGLAWVRDNGWPAGGKVLDACAGVCWTSAIAVETLRPGRTVAFDFSRHRVDKLAPLILQQYGVAVDTVERWVCDLATSLQRLDDGCIDLVIFCQALYMFPNPDEILEAVRPKLGAGGQVLIACEGTHGAMPLRTRLSTEIRTMAGHPTQWLAWHRRWGGAGYLVADSTGRFCYTPEHYGRALRQAGYRYSTQELAYPLHKGEPNVLNFVGTPAKP